MGKHKISKAIQSFFLLCSCGSSFAPKAAKAFLSPSKIQNRMGEQRMMKINDRWFVQYEFCYGVN